MNPIERVKAALYFNKPDRVPVFDLTKGDVLPLPLINSKNWKPGWGKGEEGLFPHIYGRFEWDRPKWAKNNPLYEGKKWKSIPHEEIDEWGCIWNMKGNDKDMGHPGRPSLLNWDDYDEYLTKYNPDPNDKSRYRLALRLKEDSTKEQYLMLLVGFGPSHVASAMRGFNRYLLDHKKHPQEAKKLLEHVAEYHVKCIKNSFKYGLNPHGIWIVDDLGEQSGPFFSPRLFKQIYDTTYGTICEEAHNLGMEVHHHCCGKIDPLLPVLINWGLDAIELDSPRMSGYPNLRQFRGKLMFWGCINIQSIYPLGTPEECKREVWHMIRNLGTKDGGFGAYYYPQSRDIEAPLRNIRAFNEGLKKYGQYSDIPEYWWEYPTPDDWKDNEVPPLPPLKP